MTASSEYDILINQANVGLARSQRIIASWLPPRDSDETKQAKTGTESDGAEEREFVAEPEILGIGAKPPQDGEAQRENLSNNDKLRTQLLGKDYDRKRKQEEMEVRKAYLSKSKPRPLAQSRKGVDESEDELGRSGLGKPRKKLDQEIEKMGDELKEAVDRDTQTRMTVEDSVSGQQTKARKNNYLEEVLAEKARRKKRKKNKMKHKALD